MGKAANLTRQEESGVVNERDFLSQFMKRLGQPYAQSRVNKTRSAARPRLWLVSFHQWPVGGRISQLTNLMAVSRVVQGGTRQSTTNFFPSLNAEIGTENCLERLFR